MEVGRNQSQTAAMEIAKAAALYAANQHMQRPYGGRLDYLNTFLANMCLVCGTRKMRSFLFMLVDFIATLTLNTPIDTELFLHVCVHRKLAS